MRVLLLTNKYPYPGRDGSSIAILNMIRGLLSQDMEVHLFALNASRVYVHPTQFSFDEPGELYIKSMRVNTEFTLWGILKSLFTRQSYHVSRFYSRKFEERLIQILKDYPFDVVQLEGVFMGVYLPAIRRYSPKSIVSLRAHNVEYKIWNRWLEHNKGIKHYYVKLQARRLQKFEESICRQVDCILPISEVDSRDFTLMTKEPKKVYTIHFGLKPGSMRQFSNFKYGKKKIVYLASFDWLPNRQGLDWFLKEVWPLVKALVSDAEFHVAGRGLPPRYLHYRGERLKFYGEINSPLEFLLGGKITVIPLLSGSGVRIKLLEALALGIPVISTGIGAEGVNVVNGEHLLIADNPREFAHAIALLLDDEVLRITLSYNARKLIESQYNLDSISLSLVNFYRQVSENRIAY